MVVATIAINVIAVAAMRIMNSNAPLGLAAGLTALVAFVGMLMLAQEPDGPWRLSESAMRTAIASAFIAEYIALVSMVAFSKESGSLPDVGKTLVTNFTQLVGVVVAFFLASYTQSLTMFYLTAGVIAGTGSGFGYVVPTAVGAKWFPDKRGLVVGLMVGGYGAGSGVFGPLASSLIEQVGWRSTFRILAALFFAMTIVATWLLRNPPPAYRPAAS